MKVTRTSREPVQDEGTSTRSCRHSVEDGAAGPLLCTVMIRPLRPRISRGCTQRRWLPVAEMDAGCRGEHRACPLAL